MKHFANMFLQYFLNNWSIKCPLTGIFWGNIVLRIICIFPWKKGFSATPRERRFWCHLGGYFFFWLASMMSEKQKKV